MDWKKRWTALAEFLGQALGPDYEIAVHDFTGEEPRLLALVNPQVSGRAQNAPPSNLALDFWRSRTFEGSDGRTGYRGVSASGEALRCSTFFIKDDGDALLGMLCINFASGRYDAFARSVTAFLEEAGRLSPADPEAPVEFFSASVEQVFERAVDRLFGGSGRPARLTQAQKRVLVRLLDQEGVFRLKGSAAEVARLMGASPASVYRYLTETRRTQD